MPKVYDAVIVGGGQAGLAIAYYLRRAGLDFVILDDNPGPGGAWQHTWNSLRLFSPAEYSSLPGWMMPNNQSGEFPGRDDVISYLTRYEQRYGFAIERPMQVKAVEPAGDSLKLSSGQKTWYGRAVVSATGTWRKPFIPNYSGLEDFQGLQVHSAQYRSVQPFEGLRVLVVGGGNSGAQILAEVSKVADTTWVTLREPEFLADDVDGRVLFERASARVLGQADGEPAGGIGDIVMVPGVKEARARGVLTTVRPFSHLVEEGVVWADEVFESVDAIIWCTGFKAALDHLQPLNVMEPDGRVKTLNNQSVTQPRLWLVGYGDWAGAASATLIGAGRTAREMAPALVEFLKR